MSYYGAISWEDYIILSQYYTMCEYRYGEKRACRMLKNFLYGSAIDLGREQKRLYDNMVEKSRDEYGRIPAFR